MTAGPRAQCRSSGTKWSGHKANIDCSGKDPDIYGKGSAQIRGQEMLRNE